MTALHLKSYWDDLAFLVAFLWLASNYWIGLILKISWYILNAWSLLCCARLCLCHMQPPGYLLQCLFYKCCLPFLPLEVLVSIADCPVWLCFCVTVLFSCLFSPPCLFCFCTCSLFLILGAVAYCFLNIILNFFRLCFLGSSQHYPMLYHPMRWSMSMRSGAVQHGPFLVLQTGMWWLDIMTWYDWCL